MRDINETSTAPPHCDHCGDLLIMGRRLYFDLKDGSCFCSEDCQQKSAAAKALLGKGGTTAEECPRAKIAGREKRRKKP